MKRLIVLLLFCHLASTEKHSLKFFLTSTAGISNFPEYVAIALVDEVVMGHCDSNGKRPEPRTRWMKKIVEEDPQHLEWYSNRCSHNQHVFRGIIESLKQRFNQSEGANVFQRMNGCEWDDETGEYEGFIQYGYNGEDFLTFDMETMTWIAPKPEAVITKHSWDRDRTGNVNWKNTITYQCLPFLKKYVNYGKRSLQTPVLPSVSLLQKTPSSPVSCFATGFYPDRVMMFWRKDGEEIHENVELGEILPNHDGSFQMNVDLNLSSVTPEDWRRYECVFHLSGVKDDIITKLDKAVIKTNYVPPSEFPAGPVIGGVVGLLLLAVCITGVFIWRRRNNGFRPANSSDSSSPETS